MDQTCSTPSSISRSPRLSVLLKRFFWHKSSRLQSSNFSDASSISSWDSSKNKPCFSASTTPTLKTRHDKKLLQKGSDDRSNSMMNKSLNVSDKSTSKRFNTWSLPSFARNVKKKSAKSNITISTSSADLVSKEERKSSPMTVHETKCSSSDRVNNDESLMTLTIIEPAPVSDSALIKIAESQNQSFAGKMMRQSTIESNVSQTSLTRQDIFVPESADESEAGSKNSYLLNVHLKDGKDLVIRDSSGTSDPYVKFKYKTNTIYKSRTVFKSLNPSWDEKFPHIINDLSAPLIIEVFDYDRLARDDFMGMASINFYAIGLNSDQEIKLYLSEQGSQEYMGYLNVHINLSALSTEESVNFSKRQSKSPTESSANSQKRTKISQNWISNVNIMLVEARGLRTNDNQCNNQLDSYVRFKLGSDKYRSKVIPKTSQPKWLEQFDMHVVDDQTNLLEVAVYDKRKDVCIGRCLIDLANVEHEKTNHEWYDLDDGSNGQIFLLISISGRSMSSGGFSNENIDVKYLSDSRLPLENYSLVRTFDNLSDIGRLTVKVLKAQGLAAADIGGKSDPFCVLELINERLQTHTEYKTLNPEWNKTFIFNVSDINAVLEMTIYDEDPNKKTEFLGKIVVPLLKMQTQERKWFALKDRKLQHRAKGKILLEFDVVWNPIRAAIRTVNPKEHRYMSQEEKFKRQMFMKHALRVKSVIKEIMDVWSFVQSCWSWENPARSACTFAVFIVVTYFAELYMLPFALLCLFIRGFMYRKVEESLRQNNFALEEYADSGSEEDISQLDEKEEKVGIKQRIIAVQDTLSMVQNALDYIASSMERIKNTFNFTVAFLSIMAIIVLFLLTFVLYFVPFRWIVMIWGINKFTRKLRCPNSIPNNELLDFLSRVPSDEEKRKNAEFRPDPSSANLASVTTSHRKKRA